MYIDRALGVFDSKCKKTKEHYKPQAVARQQAQLQNIYKKEKQREKRKE
jgi:hypothetical protein